MVFEGRQISNIYWHYDFEKVNHLFLRLSLLICRSENNYITTFQFLKIRDNAINAVDAKEACRMLTIINYVFTQVTKNLSFCSVLNRRPEIYEKMVYELEIGVVRCTLTKICQWSYTN